MHKLLHNFFTILIIRILYVGCLILQKSALKEYLRLNANLFQTVVVLKANLGVSL